MALRSELFLDALFRFGAQSRVDFFILKIFFLFFKDFVHEFEVGNVIETRAAGEKMQPDAQFFEQRKFAVERVRE